MRSFNKGNEVDLQRRTSISRRRTARRGISTAKTKPPKNFDCTASLLSRGRDYMQRKANQNLEVEIPPEPTSSEIEKSAIKIS
jgi:hypothetical protein